MFGKSVVRGCVLFCFFKQKTAYGMRISDWSSDVCSSDLLRAPRRRGFAPLRARFGGLSFAPPAGVAPGLPGYLPTVFPLERWSMAARDALQAQLEHGIRSEERRGGQECVSTCISRWVPYIINKHIAHT